ncbi:MAG: hypothetical protein Q8P55_01665 [bacterium]|nr:hypothetical protein [bacterium]
MEKWQESLRQMFRIPEGSAIEGFNDERKIVEIRAEVSLEMAREIERVVRESGAGYEVKQL